LFGLNGGMVTFNCRADGAVDTRFGQISGVEFVDQPTLRQKILDLKIVNAVGGFGVMNNEAPAAVTALVKASPDAIFIPGFVLAKAAQMATKTIPIVAMSEDMVAEGLVSSLARPDGNTTGISLISPDLDGKRCDLLLEALPGLRHVAVLADPNVDKLPHLQALMDSAKARGIELSVFSARAPQEIVPAMDAAKSSGAGAINVLATSLFFFNRRLVIERASELRLPAVYQWPEMAEEGGLIGYGPLFTEVAGLRWVSAGLKSPWERAKQTLSKLYSTSVSRDIDGLIPSPRRRDRAAQRKGMAKRRGDRLMAPRARALSPYRFQVEKPEALPSFQLATVQALKVLLPLAD
jgi:hypothetical protein